MPVSIFRFLTDNSRLRAGLADAQNRVETFSRRSQRSISNFARNAAASLGLVFGAAAFVRIGRNAIAMADEIDKASQRVGMSAERIQELNFAARENGVSASEMERALVRANRTLAQQPQVFERYGIAITDATGRQRELAELLPEISDRMQQAETQAERTAIANEIFGRAGEALIPMLQRGSEHIREMAEQANQLGQVMPDDTVRRLAEANDQLERIGNRLRIIAGISLANIGEFWENLTEAGVTARTPFDAVESATGDFARRARQVVDEGEDPEALDRLIAQGERRQELLAAELRSIEGHGRAERERRQSIREAHEQTQNLTNALRQQRTELQRQIDERGMINRAIRQQEEAERRLTAQMQERARQVEIAARIGEVLAAGEREVSFRAMSDAGQLLETQNQLEQLEQQVHDISLEEETRLEIAERINRLKLQELQLTERINREERRAVEQVRQREERQLEGQARELEREIEQLEQEIQRRTERADDPRNFRVSDIQRLGMGGGVVMPSEARIQQINQDQLKEQRFASRQLQAINERLQQVREFSIE